MQADDYQDSVGYLQHQSTAQIDEALITLVTTGLTAMQEARSKFLADLQILTEIDSPSDDKAGLDAMANQLAQLLQRVGMQTTIVEHPRGNAIVGSIDGANAAAPEILLLGHHDTVHPLGAAQEQARLDGKKFYGPGTVDMKAGLLQGIYALEVLQQQHYRDFSKIHFLSVPDEEISTRYHVELIRKMAQTHPLVLGLEGAGAIGTVVTQRKGCVQYHLIAEGRAAHAGSNPENGRNAVLELAHQIVQAQQLADWRPGITINAGPMRGGSKANIVSDFAEIIFDVRFLHTEDRQAIEARWDELLEQRIVPDVKLTLQPEPDVMAPMVATAESLYMAQQLQMITEQILHTPYRPETRGGASDCGTTSAAGCPSIDGLGAIGRGAHTASEYVALPPIPSRIALIAGLIVALTTKKA
jgi:Acetylornithine deacetylase/Succinyl-diaminopimelate desuccinylase and related deacylases